MSRKPLPPELPTVRDLVVRGMALGMTRAEIMRTFRIYPNQLKKWLNDETFMEEVNKYRQQQFEVLDIKIVDLYEKALTKLNELLEAENESVQLNAAKTIMSSRFEFKPKETKVSVEGKIDQEKTEDDIYFEKLRELRVAKGLNPDVIEIDHFESEDDKND